MLCVYVMHVCVCMHPYLLWWKCPDLSLLPHSMEIQLFSEPETRLTGSKFSDHLVSVPHRAGVKVPMVGFSIWLPGL